MTTLFSYLLTFFAILFWFFRLITALLFQLEIPFFSVPFNLEAEILVLFLSIPCILLVIKRSIVGAICYVAIYCYYFGIMLYNYIIIMGVLEGDILSSVNILLIASGILISILTFFDILLNIFKDRNRRINFLYTLYSCFLLFSPILIALDRFIGISGTLLTGVPLVLGIAIILHERKYLLKYIILILLFLISVIINHDFGNGSETFKPLLIFLLSLDLCANKRFLNAVKRCFKLLKKEIFIMLAIIVFLNLIMVMFSLGYSNIDTETWGLDAYMGLYSSPHQAAYRFSMLLVFIIYMYIIGYKKIFSVILIAITSFLLFLRSF